MCNDPQQKSMQLLMITLIQKYVLELLTNPETLKELRHFQKPLTIITQGSYDDLIDYFLIEHLHVSGVKSTPEVTGGSIASVVLWTGGSDVVVVDVVLDASIQSATNDVTIISAHKLMNHN